MTGHVPQGWSGAREDTRQPAYLSASTGEHRSDPKKTHPCSSWPPRPVDSDRELRPDRRRPFFTEGVLQRDVLAFETEQVHAPV